MLVLSACEDPDHVLEALGAGAAGYVLKGAPRRELATAVRKALDGEIALNRELATRLLLQLVNGARDRTNR